mgnify:CR=1 FL=1
MKTRQLNESLGTQPTLTFGCEPPKEIIGPIKPRSVQYGVQHTPSQYGTRIDTVLFTNFNKYRSDLPPWQNLTEIVAANQHNGNRYYATLREIKQCSISITGDLKTVTIVAKTVVGGLEQLSIIDRRKMGDGYQGERLQ